ncbi:hypothetical protein ACFLXE_00380 [Chloroflexota bacterium]
MYKSIEKWSREKGLEIEGVPAEEYTHNISCKECRPWWGVEK